MSTIILDTSATDHNRSNVIAVDLDDVLCQTNHSVAQWHNETYGTMMDTSHFYYYYYWKNPFWGNPAETLTKVKQYWSTDRIYNASPIPGAREGVNALLELGYKLFIVSARMPEVKEASWQWVERHFPGCFSSIECTGMFTESEIGSGRVIITRQTKAEICRSINAQLLIDDSIEHALHCSSMCHVSGTRPTPVLLFGDYEWNKRRSLETEQTDEMCFDARSKAAGGREFWKEDELRDRGLTQALPIWRAKDWSSVVEWVKNAKKDGRLQYESPC